MPTATIPPQESRNGRCPHRLGEDPPRPPQGNAPGVEVPGEVSPACIQTAAAAAARRQGREQRAGLSRGCRPVAQHPLDLAAPVEEVSGDLHPGRIERFDAPPGAQLRHPLIEGTPLFRRGELLLAPAEQLAVQSLVVRLGDVVSPRLPLGKQRQSPSTAPLRADCVGYSDCLATGHIPRYVAVFFPPDGVSPACFVLSGVDGWFFLAEASG